MKEPGLFPVEGRKADVRAPQSRTGVQHVHRFKKESVEAPARASYTSKEQVTKK